MNRKLIVCALWVFWVFIGAQPVSAVNANGIVALKKAGVSYQTIQVIAQEKVIETAAFSIADILEMKKAGVGEATLQMLMKEGSFLKNSEPIVYGKNTRPIGFTTARDVIELKQAGLSDEVIQAIIAVTGRRYHSQREEALNLLRGMGIVVDTRGNRRYRSGDH